MVMCKFDFVIVDFGLFDIDGFDVICELCGWFEVLVIVLFVCM